MRARGAIYTNDASVLQQYVLGTQYASSKLYIVTLHTALGIRPHVARFLQLKVHKA